MGVTSSGKAHKEADNGNNVAMRMIIHANDCICLLGYYGSAPPNARGDGSRERGTPDVFVAGRATKTSGVPRSR
eukprot:COSAG02_NODE_7875_length_2808_cov_10.685493_4_plen_73_part_01